MAIEATRLKEEKSAAVAQLVEQRLRVEYTDWPVIRATAIALCRSRYPILSDADAISHKGPVSNAGGTAVYRVLVPPNSEDMRMMLDVAEVLLNSHPADTSLITARRDEYLRSLETPPAEWAQKP